MLLKLLMPPYFRVIEGGAIAKWHKNEGDIVQYGDDLFDVRVEHVRITKTIKAPTAGQWLQQLSSEMKKQTGGRVADAVLDSANPDRDQAGAELAFKTWDAVVYLRVSSSDMGILRRIHVKEDEYRQVGDLLAEFTTEEGEPLDNATETAAAATFRVVVNMV